MWLMLDKYHLEQLEHFESGGGTGVAAPEPGGAGAAHGGGEAWRCGAWECASPS